MNLGATDPTNHCYTNFCGPGSVPPDAGVVQYGAAFYGPCNSSSVNDGTCLPYSFATGVIGVCQAGGSNLAGASCTLDRPVGGSPSLCAVGDVCVSSLCGSTPEQGICESVCGAVPTADAGAGGVDAGPACAASDTCVSVTTGTDWGVCAALCSPTSSAGPCPGPGVSCAAPNGNCYGLTASDAGVCLP